MKEEPEDLGPHMPKNHHAVTTAISAEEEADNPDRHHHDTTIAPDMEEAKGPSL
jgi:hypothetical protein